MPIDFHDPRNAHTYDTRAADPSWVAAISGIIWLLPSVFILDAFAEIISFRPW